jgi:hypothetical protein
MGSVASIEARAGGENAMFPGLTAGFVWQVFKCMRG